MATLNESLAAYYAIERQKAHEITEQARQLQQAIVAQLCSLQAKELTFIKRQQQALEAVRSHLALDARSLLQTAEFIAFVQDLRNWRSTVKPDTAGLIQVAPNVAEWQLHQLSTSIRLTQIEALKEDDVDEAVGAYTSYQLAMILEVGDWQQALCIPTAIVDCDPLHYQDVNNGWSRWQAIFDCLYPMTPPIPFVMGDSAVSSPERLILTQELSYLIAYTGELFTLSRFAARLGLLQNLIGH
ncbi:hypothetical protein [Leptolyngbya ohadii]|uniref:hypothetical protein n=1 Tax=Leptolyngbya ohadii TaxID=1962290 RepID=UPI00117AD3F5|nr:hypothetical protein [Leptolyngbya ohadii]